MRIQKLIPALSAAFILSSVATISHAATPPAPIVIYDNAISPDWQEKGWSWATVTEQVPAGNVQPIKVEGGPWSALAFHHEPMSTKGYTKLTFFINGGVDGGQAIAIKVLVDNKPVDSNAVINPKPKQWLPVTVPLKDIGGVDKMITGFWFQGQADAYKPYYITKIQLE